MKKEFSLDLKDQIQECEDIIKSYLPKEEGYPLIVLQAMNYSVQAGGKRIRPLLMKLAFELLKDRNIESSAVKEDISENMLHSFMAAMEMIHTFSLCHDDLPCMDNDKYRRGRESTWYHFGEDMGTLAGDALALYAFQLVSMEYRDAFLVHEKEAAELSRRFGKALFRLSECSGVDGMLGGQVLDVKKTGESLEVDELSYIYRYKTGALIAGALEIGGILAGAEDEQVSKLHQIGEKVGVAFQIQDDILDETSTQEELGKPIHSDAENHKTTYVSIHGLDEAKKEVERLSEDAVCLLHDLSKNGNEKSMEFLEGLIRYLIDRKN